VGLNPGTINYLAKDRRADINRMHSTEGAFPWFSNPHRGSNGFNNYGVPHGFSIPYPE
jgi:hypothetical protein